jgi:2'-5' RNA ligase
MQTIVAPVPADLATAIEPYRQKYDPLAHLAPPHILIIDPFQFSDPPAKLYHHLNEVGEIYAPIKVFLIGWHVDEGKDYQLHLPMTAGLSELVALRQDLLTGLLSSLAGQRPAYQPHVVLGRFSSQAELELAKKALASFEPHFSFRVEHLELWQRDDGQQPWRLERKFSLKATVASRPRRKTEELSQQSKE